MQLEQRFIALELFPRSGKGIKCVDTGATEQCRDTSLLMSASQFNHAVFFYNYVIYFWQPGNQRIKYAQDWLGKFCEMSEKNLRYSYKIVEITDYEIVAVTLLQECCENQMR